MGKLANLNNNFINKYLTLKNLNDTPFAFKEKKSILDLFSKYAGRNITSIDNIYFETGCNFGNCIVLLNIVNIKIIKCFVNNQKKS